MKVGNYTQTSHYKQFIMIPVSSDCRQKQQANTMHHFSLTRSLVLHLLFTKYLFFFNNLFFIPVSKFYHVTYCSRASYTTTVRYCVLLCTFAFCVVDAWIQVKLMHVLLPPKIMDLIQIFNICSIYICSHVNRINLRSKDQVLNVDKVSIH